MRRSENTKLGSIDYFCN